MLPHNKVHWCTKIDFVCRCNGITGTTLQWYMIAGTTPKPHLRSPPPLLSYNIIRPDTNFWHRLQISVPSEIKTQRNRINCMRQGNRHWGAFAKRCIDNRTIRHDAKGAMPIVYCFRTMHLWGSKSHAVYSIPLCFYLGWSAYLEDDVRNSWPALLYYMTEGGGFLGGALEWFQRSYIIVMPCLWWNHE